MYERSREYLCKRIEINKKYLVNKTFLTDVVTRKNNMRVNFQYTGKISGRVKLNTLNRNSGKFRGRVKLKFG